MRLRLQSHNAGDNEGANLRSGSGSLRSLPESIATTSKRTGEAEHSVVARQWRFPLLTSLSDADSPGHFLFRLQPWLQALWRSWQEQVVWKVKKTAVESEKVRESGRKGEGEVDFRTNGSSTVDVFMDGGVRDQVSVCRQHTTVKGVDVAELSLSFTADRRFRVHQSPSDQFDRAAGDL